MKVRMQDTRYSVEKNINELLDDLTHSYYQLRQSSIDEELFDVISGFEALKKSVISKT
jgi:F0F1-type ATP synthase gamma subunit